MTTTTITIRTHLDAGIYASEGGGQTRTHHTWAAGPQHLLRAARTLPEHQATMVRSYGNVGCGRSWLQIGDVRMDPMDLPETMADARALLADVQSGAYVARQQQELALQQRVQSEERMAFDAGYAGQTLPADAPAHAVQAWSDGQATARQQREAAERYEAEMAAQRQAEIDGDAAARAAWDQQQRDAAARQATERAEITARQAARYTARQQRRAARRANC